MTGNFENNNRIRSIKELKAEAKNRGYTGYSKLNRAQLTDLLNPEELIDLPIPENNRKPPTIDQLKAVAKRRGFTWYSKLNKAQLIDLVNPLNEPKPKISVPVLTPKRVKKMERVKQYAADKIATVKKYAKYKFNKFVNWLLEYVPPKPKIIDTLTQLLSI